MLDAKNDNCKTFSLSPSDQFKPLSGYTDVSASIESLKARQRSQAYRDRYVVTGASVGDLRYARFPSVEGSLPATATPVIPRGAGVAGGADAGLVTLTESVHANAYEIDQKTGEIQSFTASEGCDLSALQSRISADAQAAARSERYQLQRIARDVLIDFEPPLTGKNARRVREAVSKPLTPIIHGVPSRVQSALATGCDLTFTKLSAPRPLKKRSWRVCTCSWRALDDVKVMLSPEFKKAHFKNVAICGSVWTCPICAAKVSQRRGQELKTASETHIQAGGSLLMVTLTFSHSRHDVLKSLIGDSKRSHGLTSALQRFRNSRDYKAIKVEIEMLGLVRNLEVTHSEKNGWHPHVHELWFISAPISGRKIADIKSRLFKVWKQSCLRAGLSAPTFKHGIDIKTALTADEYMTKHGYDRKWSPEAELTRSHSKKGRQSESLTPFDFLRVIGSGSPRSDRCRQLFREYAFAFFGRAQLYWTPGLKAVFGIDEVTDEQLATEEAADSVEVATISKNRWKKVLRLPFEARGMILQIAENGGGEAVERFLFRFFGHDYSKSHFRPASYPPAPQMFCSVTSSKR